MNEKILVLAAALALTTAAPAEAGSWSLKWVGPHGGTYEGGGKCAEGVCQSSGSWTGPNGGVWRHAGDAHQVAPGQWAGQGAVTGPGGQSWKNSWSWNGAGH